MHIDNPLGASFFTDLFSRKMMKNNEENIHKENNSLKADNKAMKDKIRELNSLIEQLKVSLNHWQLPFITLA